MMKRGSLVICAILVLFAKGSYAVGVCDAALILSTYNSFSSDHIDWRLATFVSEKEWEQIKQDQGSNAVIYGIPVGETYSDFKNHVKEKISVYHESLTHDQMLNILWTGLDPNAVTAYSECLKTQLFATRGLHIAVKAATMNDISLLASWNPQGRDPATITPQWIWHGKGRDQLPKTLQQGQTTLILPRPTEAHQFGVNYPGFTDSVVLEPLSKLPTPLPELAPVIVTETFNDPAGERPSGELDNYSVYYPICTPEKPAGWKIVSCTFSLSGDRGYGGPGAQANETSHSETRFVGNFGCRDIAKNAVTVIQAFTIQQRISVVRGSIQSKLRLRLSDLGRDNSKCGSPPRTRRRGLYEPDRHLTAQTTTPN